MNAYLDQYLEQMQRLRQTIISTLGVKSRWIHGFSADEIEDLKSRLTFPLPVAYEAYLACFGHANGGLLCGGRSVWSSVSELLEASDLREVARDWQITFPPQVIVVFEHHGYMFDFIDAVEGDNPPVYHWQEGRTQITRSSWSFMAYLESAVDWAISHPRS